MNGLYGNMKRGLREGGMEDGEARAVVLLLLEKMCGWSTAEALMAEDDGSEEVERVMEMARRVAEGEPVQYVLGEAEFCGLWLKVGPGVLIPRKETEGLVEWVEEEVRQCRNTEGREKDERGGGHLSVLDVGTGSGCIAVTLARRLRGAEVEAWDVSEEALRVARENAERCGVAVRFRRVDVLQEEGEKMWDIVVSNPPYVCEEERREMEQHVLEHEPGLALFVPDDDPLLFYRRVADMGLRHLKEGGLLFFETNRRFGAETVAMLRAMGYADVELRQDIFGNDRMVKAIKREPHRYI